MALKLEYASLISLYSGRKIQKSPAMPRDLATRGRISSDHIGNRPLILQGKLRCVDLRLMKSRGYPLLEPR